MGTTAWSRGLRAEFQRRLPQKPYFSRFNGRAPQLRSLSRARGPVRPGYFFPFSFHVFGHRRARWPGHAKGAPRGALLVFGRSSRIRTYDPCLPKTVLYQAELYSDRDGPRKGSAGDLQGPQAGLLRDRFTRACNIETRGAVGRPTRDLTLTTGRLAEVPAKFSRTTM